MYFPLQHPPLGPATICATKVTNLKKSTLILNTANTTFHKCRETQNPKLHSNRAKLCLIASSYILYYTSKIQLWQSKYFKIKHQTESNLQQQQLLALHHQTVSTVWTRPRCSFCSEQQSCRQSQSCTVSVSSLLFMQTALILAGWER